MHFSDYVMVMMSVRKFWPSSNFEDFLVKLWSDASSDATSNLLIVLRPKLCLLFAELQGPYL